MKRGWFFVFLALIIVFVLAYSIFIKRPLYSPQPDEIKKESNLFPYGKEAQSNGDLDNNVFQQLAEQFDLRKSSFAMNNKAQVYPALKRINTNLDGWIVEFKEDPLAVTYSTFQDLSPAEVESKISEQKEVLIARQNEFQQDLAAINSKITIDREYTNVFSGVSVSNIDVDTLNEIRSLPYVQAVYPNMQVKANLMDSVPLINADDIWKLDKDLKPCKDTGNPCLTGKGVTIGIIDTGIDYTHPDLGGCLGANCKVVGGYDFVNLDSDPKDDMGHGTHVASIAAGKGTLNGIAPDATLYAYKVLDLFGSGYFDDVIAGIEQSTDPNQDGDFSDHLDIISLSLGGYGDPDDPPSKALDNAFLAGVVSVVAAGNDYHDEYDDGDPPNSINSPGTSRRAITVAASNKEDIIADFSSGGPIRWTNAKGEEYSLIKPDVTAPGVNICAAQFDYWLSEYPCLDDEHIAISGTSMATPHVAGLAALILQRNPSYAPRQVRSIIRNTAGPIKDWYDELAPKGVQGLGRVDALKAVSSKNLLHVQLFPLLQNNKTISITGEISGAGFANYSLAYQRYGSENYYSDEKYWHEIDFSSELPANNKLYQGFDVSTLATGNYIIRLKATNLNGLSVFDYGYLSVNHYSVNGTYSGDVFNSKQDLVIKINNRYNIPIEAVDAYYSFKGGDYTREGISTSINQDGSISVVLKKNALADLGFVSFAISINDSVHKYIYNGETYYYSTDFWLNDLYADNRLKLGFPVRIPHLRDYWQSYFQPQVADLNKDGQQEIIVYQIGDPAQLTVLDSKGLIAWSKETEQDVAGLVPAIGNLDNDPELEIVVFAAYYFWETDKDSKIFAFDSDGSLMWVAPIEGSYKEKILIADLNRDSQNEIIVSGTSHWTDDQGIVPSTVSVLNGQGKLITSWNLPSHTQDGSVAPAIGNFDDDPELEIVRADVTQVDENYQVVESQVYVFNRDGSLVSGWPVKIAGEVFTGISVGDINNDGKQDILFNVGTINQQGKAYALNRDGSLVSGWPVSHNSPPYGAPSLGDVNGDGFLEISHSRAGFKNLLAHLRYSDGKSLGGWPVKLPWTDFFGSVRGDINGDGISDVVHSSGDMWSCYNDFGQLNEGNCGGVLAFSSAGAKVDSPFIIETQGGVPPSPVLTDLDGNGKVDLVATASFDLFAYFGSRGDVRRGSLYAWEPDSKYNFSTMQWPTFQHDAQLTGCYDCPLSLTKGEALPLGGPKLVFYPFDEITNDRTPDKSGKNNDGLISGATLAAGKKGKALLFDGKDYVQSADIDLPKEFTVSAWVKLDNLTAETGQSHQIILSNTLVGSNWGPYLLRVNKNNTVEFSYYYENKQSQVIKATSQTKLKKGQWYLITARLDEGEKDNPADGMLTLFINGATNAGAVSSGKIPYESANLLHIGAAKKNDNTYQNYFWGSLDDVRIYDKALTDNEIKALL